jgi:hypothetical protein
MPQFWSVAVMKDVPLVDDQLQHAASCACCVLLVAAGDEGAEALAAAIASSSALKKLQLSGNRVSAVQLQVVQHVLKTRVYKM